MVRTFLARAATVVSPLGTCQPALEALGVRIPDVDRAFYIWIIPDTNLYWWICWYQVEGRVRVVGVSAVSQYGRLVYSAECQEQWTRPLVELDVVIWGLGSLETLPSGESGRQAWVL